jgi:hypothetical protein
MSELSPDERYIARAARTAELALGGTDPVAERDAPSANNNLIDQTRKVWQPRVGRNLSNEDARQISENVTSFFAIPGEWSRAGMPTPANDAGKPVASDNQEVRHDR